MYTIADIHICGLIILIPGPNQYTGVASTICQSISNEKLKMILIVHIIYGFKINLPSADGGRIRDFPGGREAKNQCLEKFEKIVHHPPPEIYVCFCEFAREGRKVF